MRDGNEKVLKKKEIEVKDEGLEGKISYWTCRIERKKKERKERERDESRMLTQCL